MTGRSAILLLAAAILNAQPPRPAFEVASVKPNPNCRPGASGGPSAGRVDFPCVTLRTLIRMAYGGFSGGQLNARFLDVVGGPGWLDTESFQITAKAEGNASAAVTMGPMMQTLLEERFHVKVRVESRESAVFALTVAKDASKLTPAKEGSCVTIDLDNPPKPDSLVAPPKYCGGGNIRPGNGRLIAEVPGATMAEFAGRFLSMYAGRPVIDKTGLSGRFDFRLEFLPERSPSPEEAAEAAPSIFTALGEQLGLKLSAEKAPIDVIVVDSAQKPAGN